MTSNLTLALLIGVLFGTGVVLLMSRGISRALLGMMLMSNGVNLLFIVAAGSPGRAPIVDDAGNETGITDPLPQALVLTAIVITLALTGFVMALAHRSWQLSRTDLIEDDDEAARVARRAMDAEPIDSDYDEEAPVDPRDDPDPGACYHPDTPADDDPRRLQERLP